MRHPFLLFFIAIIFFSCTTESSTNVEEEKTPEHVLSAVADESKPMVGIDMQDIRLRDTLRAIMSYSSTSYFLYRGETMGYEYELLTRLAEYLGLHLEIVVAEDMDKMFDMLQQGEGDLIAHGMTITRKRKEDFKFTKMHTSTHQTLVQRKPENWRHMKLHTIRQKLVQDPLELIGKTIHLRENSSYFQRIQNLMDEIGGEINVETVSGEYNTEDLIQMVARGEIEYTMADQNIAAINKTYNPILDISVPLSFSQRIAWVVRKNSPELLQEIDSWITDMRKKTEYYVIYNKYFKNKKAYKRRIKSDLYAANKGKVSKYDDLIKTYADSILWDWRLFASLIYQESKFDPKAKSWVGARGLVQMMPATAKELGFTKLNDPETSVKAGAKYLEKLEQMWQEIPLEERHRFVMASYNAGAGHVADARRLAKKYHADPNKWHGQVEEYLLKLSQKKYYTDEVVKFGYCRGSEPYQYVREIYQRFEHYKKFVPEG